MYTHTSSPCRFNKHPRACLAKPERFALSLLHANFWRAGEKSEASAWGLWEPQNNHWVHHQKNVGFTIKHGGCTIQNMCSLTILPSNMVMDMCSNLDAFRMAMGRFPYREQSDSEASCFAPQKLCSSTSTSIGRIHLLIEQISWWHHACFPRFTRKFTGRWAGKFWHMSQDKIHAAGCPVGTFPGQASGYPGHFLLFTANMRMVVPLCPQNFLHACHPLAHWNLITLIAS